MSVYDTEQAVKKIWFDDEVEPEGLGILFCDELGDANLTAQEHLQLRIFGPPHPERWRYFEADGKRYCWNTVPLDPRWYAPFRWMFWIETVTETDEYIETQRDPDSIRFADLRREAKDEAYAQSQTAKQEASAR